MYIYNKELAYMVVEVLGSQQAGDTWVDGIILIQVFEKQESWWCPSFSLSSMWKEKTTVSATRQSGREKILSYSGFCSIQAFSGLDEAYPHWGEKYALLDLLIQIWISSSNSLTDRPRRMFGQMSRHLMTQLS